jgi:hypothetical protein
MDATVCTKHRLRQTLRSPFREWINTYRACRDMVGAGRSAECPAWERTRRNIWRFSSVVRQLPKCPISSAVMREKKLTICSACWASMVALFCLSVWRKPGFNRKCDLLDPSWSYRAHVGWRGGLAVSGRSLSSDNQRYSREQTP